MLALSAATLPMLSRAAKLDRNRIADEDPDMIPTVHELLLPAIESPVAKLTAEILAAESVAAGPVVERATALPGASLNSAPIREPFGYASRQIVPGILLLAFGVEILIAQRLSVNRKLSTKLRRKPWRSTRGGCVVLQINMVWSEDVRVEGGRDSRRPHGIRSAKDNRKKVSKDDAN